MPVLAADATDDSAIPSKYRNYKELTPRELKTMPEEYEGDRVYVEGAFAGFTASLPVYVERNGFRTGRYVMLTVAGSSMPIIAKKDDDTNEMLLALKKGATIRVFGRVREFHQEAMAGIAPRFYVDCAYLQVLKTTGKLARAGSDAAAPERTVERVVVRRPRRRLR
jgi:hypothetical protein